MSQPHAYTTPIRRNPLPDSQAKVFFTLIQGISTATYLTFPRLPRRPIGPEPFQYSLPVAEIYWPEFVYLSAGVNLLFASIRYYFHWNGNYFSFSQLL